MSRKNFPKAVTRTAEEMREGVASTPSPATNVVAMLPTPTQPAPVQDAVRALTPDELEAARRHALAGRLMVERHATYAAIGGFIPLPLLDFSAVAGIILRMVKVLSDHYGVPFQRERARAIIISLMAGAAPAGMGTVAASTASFFIPGGLFVGLAVSSVTATVCARTIGRIFIEHFESGGTLADFPVVKKR